MDPVVNFVVVDILVVEVWITVGFSRWVVVDVLTVDVAVASVVFEISSVVVADVVLDGKASDVMLLDVKYTAPAYTHTYSVSQKKCRLVEKRP